MYEEFYGLTKRPFLTVPDPESLYWSDGHSHAFAMLRYGLMSRAPVTVVTGEIGAGKTTLIRRLLAEMPDELTVGLVSNMTEDRGALIEWIMMAFGLEFGDESYVRTFARFQDFVIERYAEGRRVVLIVDEAQNLGVKALEELRLFSNINADGHELLQIILSGQPQLRELLSRPELVQFSQRISADYHLERLTAEETVEYIAWRLYQAGGRRRVFTRLTAELIHEVTGGVPRLINILCDLTLVYGFAAEYELIDDALLREFLADARERGIYTQFIPISNRPVLVPEKTEKRG